MGRFRRACLRCGALSFESYCPKHEQEIKALQQKRKDTPERLARKRQLYGGDYRQRRKQLLGAATHCAICSKEFVSGDAIDADHVIPSDPGSPLQATHAYCNRAKGNRTDV